jgi:hypothetical protein
VKVRANGSPWYDLDKDGWPTPPEAQEMMDWPHPEAGAGIDTELAEPAQGSSALESGSKLAPEDVPKPGAGWLEISKFALGFDGYEHFGDEPLTTLANHSAEHFRSKGFLPVLNLSELRGCLFFE